MTFSEIDNKKNYDRVNKT